MPDICTSSVMVDTTLGAVQPDETDTAVQMPPVQTGVLPLQMTPHAPQLRLSLLGLAQYTAPPSGLHVSSLGWQLTVHTPPEQMLPAPHVMPQPPQLAPSV